VYPAAESLQQTHVAGFDERDHDLRHDASIVVMSELHRRCQVLTIDRKDFSIYRRNDRQTIDFIAPRKP